jgi:tRNA 2-thiouridine synthesizing protein A
MSFRRRARNNDRRPPAPARDRATQDRAAQAQAARAQAPVVPPPYLVVDALGRKCPIPIIMVAERIREIPVGSVVAVLADDVAARNDVPAWCRMKSQEFVGEETLYFDQPSGGAQPPATRGWAFHIRRMY